MLGEFNEDMLENMRQLARDNKPVDEILKYLIKALCLTKNSRLIAITYFCKAFSLGIRDVSPIGAWEFFDGGTWSSEDVDNEIGVFIRQFIEHED